jgi:simple sugar transport system permease protein
MRNTGKIIKIPFIGEFFNSSGRTVLGILLGIIAGGILIAFSGVNPFGAYASMLRGAFNSPQSFSNVLVRSSPLLLGGIGVALGIKSGVWNTGIEGYMYLGAIGATIVAVLELGVPPIVHILLCFVVGMIFAGCWGAIPGYLRAYKGVNEVTSTIMMSYIAIYLTNWIVSSSPLAQKDAYFPMSLPFVDSALLPILMKGTSLHLGPFIGLVICIIFYFILKYTPFGFRTRMLGYNPFAAQYAGVNSRKQIVKTMVIGAMLGGLAGALEVIGLKHRLYMGFVTGVGYESIAVALVAGGNPIGVMVSALFFSVLKVGGATMSIDTGVSSSMASIIIALCVLFVVGVGVSDAKRIKRKDKKVLAKQCFSSEKEDVAK